MTRYPVVPYFLYGGCRSGIFVVLSNVFDFIIGLYTNVIKRIVAQKAYAIIYADNSRDLIDQSTKIIFRKQGLLRVEPAVTFQTFFPRSVFSSRAQMCLTLETQPDIHQFRIVWCGTFEKRKLFGLFYEITKRLKNSQGIIFEFVVIGAGPELDYWKNKAQVDGIRIQFTGQITNEAVSEYFRNSALFVSTSLRDLDPNVIIENILAGTRFVCFSRILSNKSWFKKHGTLIDEDNGNLIESFLSAITAEVNHYPMHRLDSTSRRNAVLDLLKSVSINNAALAKILNGKE